MVGGRWTLGEKLGRGSFATVWRGTCAKTGVEVAVKEIDCERLSKKLRESLKLEVEVMRKMRDDHILRFIDMETSKDTVYIVLEYCGGGDLSQFIKRHGRVDESAAKRFMLQLARGLRAMRKAQLVHRDLKPQNLLLTSDDLNAELKIADFGWSVHAPNSRRQTLCGTLDYLPPEMVEGRDHDSAVDVWSLGVLAYEFLCGVPPFEAEGHSETYKRILRVDLHFPAHVSVDARDMISGLLVKDPKARLPLSKLLDHPWIKNNASPNGIPQAEKDVAV